MTLPFENPATLAHAASTLKAGLEGVIAGTSKICEVIGDKGELYYWGYSIHDLAQGATFEEVVYLLWHGELPKKSEVAELRKSLNQNTSLDPLLQDLLKRFPKDASPMAVLRSAVSALGMDDEHFQKTTVAANVTNKERSVLLVGQCSAIVAGFERVRRGQDYIAPLPELSFAENFLYILTGKKPDTISAKAFDMALVLHADHEFNASTFAARITASTLADIYSAVTSAIGALQGPLHGGANEAVMKMLREIGDVSRVETAIHERLAQKRKIPGFGHRVYKAEDPRATHLRQMAKALGERMGNTKWYDMLKKIEEIMWKEKRIYSNVDCYSAAVYDLLKIPTDLFTPIFAISRMSGWTAHILEQYSDNRLIRPASVYIGPRNRVFVPLEKR